MINNPKDIFWFQSDPKRVTSQNADLVVRHMDIEAIKVYDANGNHIRSPQPEKHYPQIHTFVFGKKTNIIYGGFIKASDSREPYEYDVYSSSRVMARIADNPSRLRVV